MRFIQLALHCAQAASICSLGACPLLHCLFVSYVETELMIDPPTLVRLGHQWGWQLQHP